MLADSLLCCRRRKSQTAKEQPRPSARPHSPRGAVHLPRVRVRVPNTRQRKRDKKQSRSAKSHARSFSDSLKALPPSLLPRGERRRFTQSRERPPPRGCGAVRGAAGRQVSAGPRGGGGSSRGAAARRGRAEGAAPGRGSAPGAAPCVPRRGGRAARGDGGAAAAAAAALPPAGAAGRRRRAARRRGVLPRLGGRAGRLPRRLPVPRGLWHSGRHHLLRLLRAALLLRGRRGAAGAGRLHQPPGASGAGGQRPWVPRDAERGERSRGLRRGEGERGERDWGSPHGAGGGGVVRQTRCTELLPCVGERRCQQNGALTHGCGERTFNLALIRAVRGSASCDSQCPPGPKQWRGALGTPWGLFLIQRTGISPG